MPPHLPLVNGALARVVVDGDARDHPDPGLTRRGVAAVGGPWQGRRHGDPTRSRSSPPDEVREAAGLDDWRHLLTGIRARFRTGDFATGLALVDRIGAAAEEADHHPDISLTYPEVIVTLSSHDVGGITSRDLDLARLISGFAAELGAEADVSGLTQLEPGLDTSAPGCARRVLRRAPRRRGEERRAGRPQRAGAGPVVPGAPATGGDLPTSRPRTRAALALRRLGAARRGRAAAPGRARRRGHAGQRRRGPSYWVVEDADGNRSCICTPMGR